ncbi:MAG: type II/IV secretion system ATPase subunit [Candidatus Woesearchaeota archaeon]
MEKEVVIDSYSFLSNNIPVKISIKREKNSFVPIYHVELSTISNTTKIILEKIREELIQKIDLGVVDITDTKKENLMEEKFKEMIILLVKKHFPEAEENIQNHLIAYLIQRSLGFGDLEILMADKLLEEIVVNSAEEPVWVYHKKYGWLKTNIAITKEEEIRHYATMMARRVGRQITVLSPLLDANLKSGDRVNCTLEPISANGNTITLRKFASEPWTITKFLESKTISEDSAALIWLAVQYELSILIAGGTASGKTSTLNAIANFFPPNQRVISIEDTREIVLPKFLHWVPMVTRQPNTEGKGEITMLDLLVNSLRMRPDRIIVGEVRRQREAEILFEAIHTGHSVYATVHANNVQETITRLTSPPINIPKSMIPAISMIMVQYRNRRTGIRRTFQIAEILPDATPNILMQFDIKKDEMNKINKSISLMDTLQLYTGYSRTEIEKDIDQKIKVLKWLVQHKISDVNHVGRIMAEYYTNNEEFMKIVEKNKDFNFEEELKENKEEKVNKKE